jgi:prepilin peptidase CpaA
MHSLGATAIIPLAGLLGLLTWCAIEDVRSRTIPHAAIAAIIVLFVPYALAGHGHWLQGLISAVILLLAGFALFYFRVMGGGDAKLIAALGLWVGLTHLVSFLLYTAMAGGVVTLGVVIIHRIRERNSGIVERTIPTVPYGVAIAFGGIIAAWQACLTEAF